MKTLVSDKALESTIVVAAGSMVGAVFAYLLQLFLGRTISIENYGTFNALLSLSYLISVPAAVFGMSLVKTVVDLWAKNEKEKLSSLFWKLVIISMIIGFGLFLIFFMFRSQISTKLNIGDPKVLIFFGMLMGLSFYQMIIPSYFQGLQRYRSFAFFHAFSSFLRLLFPVIFVVLGYELYGVFGGMVAGVITAFVICLFLLKRNLTKYTKFNLSKSYKRILSFGFPVMFLNLGLIMLNNMDVILTKKFFSPLLTGYYAGTVTLGKIFLFGASAVAMVMFPMISGLYARREDYMPRFKKLFFLQLLLVIGGLSVFIVFPKFITTLFFGERFLSSVEYLPYFSVFIGLYILINFLTQFFLAIEKVFVSLFLIPGILVQIIVISLNHRTIYDVIFANIGASIITLTLLGFYFFINIKWRKKLA